MSKFKSILFVLIILCGLSSKAQKAFYSPDLIFDSIYDSDGKKYYLDTLKINTTRLYPDGNTVQALCTFTNSYFNVYFEPGCGMELNNPTHNTRRNTICQLFQDISNFISNAGGVNNKVNVWVRDPNFVINNAGSNPSPGKALSFYSYPYAPSKSGIVDNLIWQTIVSGQDAYKGITSPLITSTTFYHAIIAFNYANTSINWHDDLATVPTSTTSFDLYNVGLHEITHALGFETGINFNGASKITTGSNYYTRFDRFLKTQSNVALISSTGGCSMYNYSFNTTTTAINPNISSCGGNPPSTGYSNSTNCSTAIWFASPTQTVPVYTPDCYEDGASLAHFEDMCYPPPPNPSNNDQYFVMAGQGPLKRFLKEEERKVLCNLGYSVAATYGTPTYSTTQKTYTAGVCNGIGVAGINDGLGAGGVYTYTTNVNVATGTIQPLSNDYGVSGGSYECVEVVIGTGNLSATSGNLSTPFNYTPTSGGLHLLRYVPVNSGGTRGNITYIYVKVLGAGTCSVTLPNSCEMVYNGSFENGNGICGTDFYNIPNPLAPINSCWSLISGYYSRLLRNCTSSSNGNPPSFYSLPTTTFGNIDTWNGSPNNTLIYSVNGFLGNQFVLLGNLTNSLTPSSQYKISFWAKDLVSTSIPYSSISQMTINLVSSPQGIIGPISLSNTVSAPFTNMGSLPLVRDGNWHNYSAIITYTGAPQKNITFLATQQLSTIGGAFVIDDVSILPASSASAFNLPAEFCIPTSTVNLGSFVSVPNGTFTGPGVSLVGSNYIFNANSAGTGLKTLIYTYTVTPGCTLTAIAQTSVVNTPNMIITTNPPAGLCPGYSTATITASGANSYTFTNGVTTTYTNPAVVSPTITTSYTITGANSTCTNSAVKTITVSPSCLCMAQHTLASTLASTVISSSTYTNYAINSNLTITSGTVSFQGVEILIAAGVSITVNSGATLLLDRAHLYSCFDMWQGIVILPGGRLVTKSESLVEDAVNAVLVASHTATTNILDIDNTTFNRNNTAISVSNYTAIATTYPFSIKNTIFTSRTLTFTPTTWPGVNALKTTCTLTNNLASPYCLQNFPATTLKAPYSSNYANTGIKLTSVGRSQGSVTPTYYGTVIGDYLTASNFNIFDNLYYGINAVDANIKAYNNIFQNSQWYYDFFLGQFIGGIGIAHNTSTFEPNTNLLLMAPAPYTMTRKNKFYDCTYAVQANNIYEVKAEYLEVRSTFTINGLYTSGKHGLYLTTNRFRLYDINNNQLYNIKNSITYNTSYGNVKIGGTTFPNSQYSGSVNINYNTIKPVASGGITNEFVSNAINTQNILSAGSTQTVLAGALIKINGNIVNDAYRAVYCTNFKTPPVVAQGNVITLRNDASGLQQYGVAVTTCTSSTVTTNNITGPNTTNTIISAVYASQSYSNSVTCNTVTNTYKAFEFSGSQPGTIWKGNSMTTHTLGLVLTNTAVIGQQGSAGNPIDNAWNGTWVGAKYNTYNSANSLSINSPLWVKNSGVYFPTNYASVIFGQDYGSGGLNTTTGAYSCGSGGGGGASMMTSTGNSEESAFISLLVNNTKSEVSSLSGFNNNNYITQFQTYRILDSDVNLRNSSKSLSSFYNDNKTKNYDILLSAEKDLIENKFNSSSLFLNGISTKNNIEFNYEDFYRIYNNYYSGNFTNTDKINLQALCEKCPFTEGEVIYQARALNNIINKTYEIYNDNCPQSSMENSRLAEYNPTNDQTAWDIVLYPNPAYKEINIRAFYKSEVIQVNITDISGRLIQRNHIYMNEYIGTLELGLSNGTYLLHFTNDKNQTVIKKLVVIN